MQQWLFCVHRSVLPAVLLLLGGGFTSVNGHDLAAQDHVQIPAEAVLSADDIGQVLRHGVDLERQRRWTDALSYYEEALRNHPQRDDLQQRLTLSRIHCDVARRYADPAFKRLAATQDEQLSMETYAEVLLKIQLHYVDPPDWQDLLWRGTANLDVALTKPVFLKSQIPQATAAQVDEYRRELRRSINTRQVRGRDDSRQVVALAARTASHRLGLAPTAVVLEYVCGAVGALDEYSGFLTDAQLEDVYGQIEGNFVGLGIELKADEGSLLITNVIADGPADHAGIRDGDRITEVDGQPTKDLSSESAADLLKGTIGSIADLAVLSAGGQSRRLKVRRDRVEVPSVEDRQLIDQQYGIGYFRLTSFQKTTSRDVDAALWKLHHEGMKSLIIDVRGNPGGLLTASVEVADKFLRDGVIVATRGRSPRESYDYKAHRVGAWPVPLIVLIDGDTASASEIFAGAIRDHRRGEVIGQRSYGKGSVQGIFPLQITGSGIRLTTAKFFSPSGQPISKRGVEPNAVVHQVAKATGQTAAADRIDPATDLVLAHACQVARRQIVAQR